MYTLILVHSHFILLSLVIGVNYNYIRQITKWAESLFWGEGDILPCPPPLNPICNKQ